MKDKMDPEGPGRHAPRQCSTLTLADLGDTVGFRDPGDSNKIYGLRLDPKGYYSRAAIDHHDDDDWDVQLELRRGYTYIEHGQMLVRLDNLGKALVSYQACRIMGRNNKDPTVSYNDSLLKVVCPKALTYGVKASEVKARVKFCMKCVPQFDEDLTQIAKPPKLSTIYLELHIPTAAQAEPIPVLSGVSIKWAASASIRHIALILTCDNDMKWSARATAQDIVVDLKDPGADEIIFSTVHAFVRLLFSSSPVSEYRIEQLISQLKN